MIILDTDVLSVVQRGDNPEYERLANTDPSRPAGICKSLPPLFVISVSFC